MRDAVWIGVSGESTRIKINRSCSHEEIVLRSKPLCKWTHYLIHQNTIRDGERERECGGEEIDKSGGGGTGGNWLDGWREEDGMREGENGWIEGDG